jgi:hypothetical protein
MTYRRVLDCMIGFTDTLYTVLGTIGNTALHTLQKLDSILFDSIRFDSIEFLCSQAHILAGWLLETRLTLLN